MKMPRKKKIEAAEKKIDSLNEESKGIIEKTIERIEGVAEEVAENVRKKIRKSSKKNALINKDKMQTKEELKAKIEDSLKENAEEKPKKLFKKDLGEKGKKKEIKLLSEKELKRVMTDTKETLVPLTDYIKCSVHLGTKVITPDMRKYVYKRRADGLAVINTNLIDDKMRSAIDFLNNFDAKDIFIVCKREAGWPATEKFSEVTGIRKFTKKYPAGIITNLNLSDFFEAKLVIVCDPWVDKNALNDATKLTLPVIGICDTNNYAKGVTKVIIGNNKSLKSIGLILYILAREYLRAKGMDKEAKSLNIEDFTGKLEDIEIK